jgi:hypothetical protein
MVRLVKLDGSRAAEKGQELIRDVCNERTAARPIGEQRVDGLARDPFGRSQECATVRAIWPPASPRLRPILKSAIAPRWSSDGWVTDA